MLTMTTMVTMSRDLRDLQRGVFLILTESHQPTMTTMSRGLRDLQEGAAVPGDCGAPHDVMPPWMDRDRFNRGREFFQRHLPGIFLSNYMSIIFGFGVESILDVLLYTGKSSAAEQAMKRYKMTARRLTLWHDGDVWDVNSKAHASVMAVRNIHGRVATAITKNRKGNEQGNEPCVNNNQGNELCVYSNPGNEPGDNKDCNSAVRAGSGCDGVFVSQYDMALGQSGFVGFVPHAKKFGILCTVAELEDYIFFWRGIGYLLGMEDEYNMCSGNFAETCQILTQIEDGVIKPGMQNPPKGYDVATTSLIEGTGLASVKDVIFLYAYDLMDLPMYKVSMGDRFKLKAFKWIIWLTERVPGFYAFFTWGFSVSMKRENPD